MGTLYTVSLWQGWTKWGKYRIKYKYSLLTAKPNLVYKPENNICYDAILCYGMYEANFLKVFSNVELIGNLKYLNLKPLTKPSTNKPILLYLPTYGDVSSIRNITSQLEKYTKNTRQKFIKLNKFANSKGEFANSSKFL